MAHYLHDDNNNLIEGMSKEEIYALLEEAIESGELPSVDENTAFVTMVKSIVDGDTYKMAFCTQTQYNNLEEQGLLESNALYIITDDETYDDLEEAISANVDNISSLDTTVSSLNDTKLDKDSETTSGGNEVKATIYNSNGIIQIETTYGEDYSLRLIFNQSDLTLIKEYLDEEQEAQTDTYDIKTYLDYVAELYAKSKSIYKHDLIITTTAYTDYPSIFLSILSNSATAITATTLSNYFSENIRISATGSYMTTSTTTGTPIMAIYTYNGYWFLIDTEFLHHGFSINTITDNVTQLL